VFGSGSSLRNYFSSSVNL